MGKLAHCVRRVVAKAIGRRLIILQEYLKWVQLGGHYALQVDIMSYELIRVSFLPFQF